MDSYIHSLAEKIWLYHRMNHRLEKADAILVLCSHDKRVAERGAQLLLDGWASLLIFSGGLGSITGKMWSEPEADKFAKIAFEIGVPERQVLIENRSTNTGENILFTKRLLVEKGLNPKRFILVQKPYMERRSYATLKKMWPEAEAVVTSQQVSFEEYLSEYGNPELSAGDVVSIMVGDLQRIELYPGMGFQIRQEIPDDVRAAYEELIRAGYDKHLIRADVP